MKRTHEERPLCARGTTRARAPHIVHLRFLMFNMNKPSRRLLLRDALPAEIGKVSSPDSLFDIIVSISRRIERQFLTHLNGSHRKGSMSKNNI